MTENTKLVQLEYPQKDIAVLTLQDHANKNMITPALDKEISESFARINENPEAKVVVIHGYGNYFCCGSYKEGFQEIATKKHTFDSMGFLQSMVHCPIPTIAAMQGHAIGGGLTLGLLADLQVMALEAVYTSNYLNYGLTPGLASTWLIPKKLGPILGTEMLYTAKFMRGRELQARGAGPTFVTSSKVIETAMDLAKNLAEKPRHALKLLKEEMTREFKSAFPEVIKREIAMQEYCFAQPDVAERVALNFEKGGRTDV